MPEPPQTTEDDLLARRLTDFFAQLHGTDTETGPAQAPPPPAAPHAAPPGGRPDAPATDTRPAASAPATPPPPPAPAANGAPTAVPPPPPPSAGPSTARVEALVEQTREDVRQATERVLAALTALEGRVARLEARPVPDPATMADDLGLTEFRDGLFDWLEGYSQWEAEELQDIRARVAQLYQLFVPGAVPSQPQSSASTASRSPRFGPA